MQSHSDDHQWRGIDRIEAGTSGSKWVATEPSQDDAEVLAANPFFADLGKVLGEAVARPSSLTGGQYAQVSTLFWEAAHDTLTGNGRAQDNLARLENRLDLLRARAHW